KLRDKFLFDAVEINAKSKMCCSVSFGKLVCLYRQQKLKSICCQRRMNMNTDKIFAEAIANEYAPKNASKVLALKKLDRKAKRKANIFAYTFGTLMALVLGTGMCLSMG